jgi:hypothetical protein
MRGRERKPSSVLTGPQLRVFFFFFYLFGCLHARRGENFRFHHANTISHTRFAEPGIIPFFQRHACHELGRAAHHHHHPDEADAFPDAFKDV